VQSVSDEALARVFRSFPGMEYCDLKKDRATGRSKGYAYVSYLAHEAAAAAQVRVSSWVCIAKGVSWWETQLAPEAAAAAQMVSRGHRWSAEHSWSVALCWVSNTWLKAWQAGAHLLAPR